MVEELGATDAEHRAVESPALAVTGVADIAQPPGELRQVQVAQLVQQGLPHAAGGWQRAVGFHGRISSQADWTWSVLTLRALPRAAAASE